MSSELLTAGKTQSRARLLGKFSRSVMSNTQLGAPRARETNSGCKVSMWETRGGRKFNALKPHRLWGAPRECPSSRFSKGHGKVGASGREGEHWGNALGRPGRCQRGARA